MQKDFKLQLMRVTPLSHSNTSSFAVLQWLRLQNSAHARDASEPFQHKQLSRVAVAQ